MLLSRTPTPSTSWVCSWYSDRGCPTYQKHSFQMTTVLPCFCTLQRSSSTSGTCSLCFALASLAASSVPVALLHPLTSCSAPVSTLGTTTLLSFHPCILTLPLSSYLPSHPRHELLHSWLEMLVTLRWRILSLFCLIELKLCPEYTNEWVNHPVPEKLVTSQPWFPHQPEGIRTEYTWLDFHKVYKR